MTAAASLGVHTLTFGSAASNNFGVTVINGDITQGAGTTLGITVAGGGGNGQFITLAGQTAATNFSGGLTFNVGTGLATVRVTNAYALGTGGISFTGTTGAATLEVRSDTSLSFANNITLAHHHGEDQCADGGRGAQWNKRTQQQLHVWDDWIPRHHRQRRSRWPALAGAQTAAGTR